MKIKELDSQYEQLWDEFVGAHQECTMYHLWGWKNVLEKEFGFQARYLIAFDDQDAIVGVLPLFVMRDLFGNKYLISNPFSNFAGVCAVTQDAKAKLIEYACDLARQEKVRYIEFRHLGEKKILDFPAKESFVNFMLELETGVEEMWQGLSSRNRGKVRKAKKSGLAEDSGKKYLPAFYKIFTKNLKRLGTPVFSYSFFETLMAEFPEQTDIFVLNLDSKTVSAMFMFKFRDTIAEPWVGSLADYNKIYVNNLLYWRAICYAHERGFRFFDFGRSTDGAGTYRFKKQWGAVPVPLYYEYFLNRAESIPKVDAVDNKYQFFIDAWKKLPLAITNFVGPKVVKFLPEL
ncbi:MAG: FemAB family PEP-CTERM system-associated protein [Calditrichaeota bacterium]|nr:FemAB family PEP-CTERM system-associated protein [Calditrichota bacterium]